MLSATTERGLVHFASHLAYLPSSYLVATYYAAWLIILVNNNDYSNLQTAICCFYKKKKIKLYNAVVLESFKVGKC